jgi:hypothetical protein
MLSETATIGDSMPAEQLLEYLHESPATRALAAELAEALVLRRRRVRAAANVKPSGSRRIAS